MFKRIMLGLTFVAAFGLVGVVTPDTSEARRYWGRPRVARYYGAPRRYYRSYRPAFRRSYYYGPPSYYYGYPGGYGPRRGVYFSFGY